MINDNNLEQQNEGSGAAYQAGRDIVVNGVSYTEAKQIALDLWKANALELSQQAAHDALGRVDDFLNSFLAKLNEKDPALFNSLKDPGMQMALFAAQRDYAKTGDRNVFELLIEILSNRAEHPDRSLIQIILEECLIVVPKITEEQLDLLSLKFILMYVKNVFVIDTKSRFAAFMNNYIQPFCESQSKKRVNITHLEYCGCIALQTTITTQNAMPWTDLITAIQAVQKEYFIKNDQFGNESIEMSLDEMKNHLETNYPFMQSFIGNYQARTLNAVRLTSVGLALAQANFTRKTGVTLNLDRWVD